MTEIALVNVPVSHDTIKSGIELKQKLPLFIYLFFWLSIFVYREIHYMNLI